MKKRVLIYYKYVTVDNIEQEKQAHLDLCKELSLTGRVLLAKEGINGTVCGLVKDIESYVDAMNKHPLFDGMDFKWADVDPAYDYFPKLQVKIRSEIVRLDISPDDLTPHQGGKHLTPEQVHKLMQDADEDLIVLDTRNDYEWRIGAFERAMKPNIKTFKEFPQYIEEHLDEFKDKKVLMYCTAGVRCERATAVLKEKNIAKEVYQIKGGIQRYVEKYPDGYFRGKNYVFDNRIAVKVTDDVLSECDLCEVKCDEYTNCRNAFCNNHYISCDNCLKKYNNSCSQKCADLIAQGKTTVRPPLQKVMATK